MLALTGTGIGRRVAIGKAMVLDRSRQEIPKYEVSQDQVQSEIKRFQSALARTRAELRRIQQEIPDHAPHGNKRVHRCPSVNASGSGDR